MFNCFFLIASIVVVYIHVYFRNFTRKFFLKNLVLFCFCISFGLFMLQFFIYMRTPLKNLSILPLDFFSYLICFICYVVGFISLLTLGDRFWSYNKIVSILFLYFPFIILRLVRATSLLEIFLYYELLLLPSIFFVYNTAYTRRSQQANLYFFIWTQLGSIIALLGCAFLIALINTTNVIFVSNHFFTRWESFLLYLFFFVGFGVKVPIWPFHFWLTKVHVEAPSGFSIFLSGFLVKSAVYCFYKFTLVLFNYNITYIFPIICIVGGLDGSLKMWGQTDIKKLIAYATIQEMNIIFFLFNINDSHVVFAGFIFLLAHSFLSSLMFYMVEVVYKRTHSRSIYKIFGLSEFYPNLTIGVWLMMILFFGFPGTPKFFAEVYLLSIFLNINLWFTLLFALIFIFIGSVGFAKNWLSILYGHPGNHKPTLDLTFEEIAIIIFLFLLSLASCFFFTYI